MKSNPCSIEITLTAAKLKKALGLLCFLNIIMLFGTWLANSNVLQDAPHSVERFVSQLNLGTENVFATWFSSILLLLVALVAACCYLVEVKYAQTFVAKLYNLGWIGFVLVFLLLSFDEMGSFHEMIGETQLFKTVGKGVGGGGWYLFYLLVILVGIFMMIFFLVKFLQNKVALVFAVLGVLLFLSNPIQENYEINSWRNAPDPSLWQRPMFFLLLEEGSEICASLFLLISFTIYLRSLAKKYSSAGAPAFIIFLPRKNTIVLYTLGLVVLSGILMLIVRWNAWNFETTDGESAQNWFPSVVSFIVAAEALYLYYHSRNTSHQRAFTYLLIGIFAILSSAFFGSNMHNSDSSFFQRMHIALVLGGVLSVFLSLSKFPGSLSRLAISGFVISIVFSFYTIDFSASSWEYLGYSCLCLAFILSPGQSLRPTAERTS